MARVITGHEIWFFFLNLPKLRNAGFGYLNPEPPCFHLQSQPNNNGSQGAATMRREPLVPCSLAQVWVTVSSCSRPLLASHTFTIILASGPLLFLAHPAATLQFIASLLRESANLCRETFLLRLRTQPCQHLVSVVVPLTLLQELLLLVPSFQPLLLGLSVLPSGLDD